MDHDESPELIEQKMHDTRDSLARKVAALEQQVVGNIETATSAVQSASDMVENLPNAVSDTADSVRDTVKETLHAAVDTVKRALDVSGHVREHPWASVGCATATGFVLGLLAFGRSSAPSAAGLPFTAAPAAAPGPLGRLFNDLVGHFSDDIKRVAKSALDTASTSLQQSLKEQVPQLVSRFTHPTASGGDGTEVRPTMEYRNGRHSLNAG